LTVIEKIIFVENVISKHIGIVEFLYKTQKKTNLSLTFNVFDWAQNGAVKASGRWGV
jgi:hypothetical protein